VKSENDDVKVKIKVKNREVTAAEEDNNSKYESINIYFYL